MKVIFAFTSVTNHYKPLNNDFLKLAKLSVKSASKFYKTKIYCDTKSLNIFNENNITFDEVILIDDFIKDYTDNYLNTNQYSISKIYAMMQESEPYILMDLDVVLFEKLESTHTITYGQPELRINEYLGTRQLEWVNKSYLNPFSLIKGHFSDEEIGEFDWITYPSFCVIMVKNPLFVSETYNKILNKIPKKDVLKITPTLLEQFLFHQSVIKHMVDFGFFISNIYYSETVSDFMSLISQKFVHLNINKQTIKEEIEYLEKIV
jgi:hypothetical protein